MSGDVWEQLASEFNREAERFDKAAEVVDPALPMTEVFDMPKKIQEAWTDANSALAKLTALINPLHVAAKLAGVCGNSRDSVLRLLVDHENHAGERVERIGFDWLALRKAGVSIRAVTRLEDAKPWAVPVPESAVPQPPSATDVAWLRSAGMAGDWDSLYVRYDE
ncbi:hypothetical protein [Nocardia nova]|uniref:hypothetical protein n=1 Tax=Nocardia nova TaxID=37330 RepID=UPI0018940811|nr:hypothetical protein [Nocardia nova]MBF6278751.1 hypothetical protein [Nocardia nova]